MLRGESNYFLNFFEFIRLLTGRPKCAPRSAHASAPESPRRRVGIETIPTVLASRSWVSAKPETYQHRASFWKCLFTEFNRYKFHFSLKCCTINHIIRTSENFNIQSGNLVKLEQRSSAERPQTSAARDSALEPRGSTR